MKIDRAKEIIKNILTEKGEEKVCLQIDGHWGIGKTYMVEELMKEINKESKFIYTSCFGCDNVRSLETSLILKLITNSDLLKKPSRGRGALKSLSNLAGQLSGLNIDSIIASFSIDDITMWVDDYKEKIICFDDLERISSNLELKTLLGFLEKTSKYFKVIVISNVEMMDDEGVAVFKEYKEKVIDKTLIIDELQESVLDKIIKASKIKTIDNVATVYIKGNVGFGKSQQNKPYYNVAKINNLRIFKKYLHLIFKIENKLNNEVILNKSILSLCKDIVYGYYYPDDNKKNSDQATDVYGLRKTIEKIFNHEDINKEDFKEYFDDCSEVKKDIKQIYLAYELTENELTHLINKISEKINDKNNNYISNQREVLSIFDALVNIGYESDALNRAIKIRLEDIYEPNLEHRPRKINSEDWDGYDEWGQEECNRKTYALVEHINSYNKNKYNDFIDSNWNKAIFKKDIDMLFKLASIKKINDKDVFGLIFNELFEKIINDFNLTDDKKIYSLINYSNLEIAFEYIDDLNKKETRFTVREKLKRYKNRIDLIERELERSEFYRNNHEETNFS